MGLGTLVLSACASSADGEGPLVSCGADGVCQSECAVDPDCTAQPTTCDPADRSGSYWVDYITLSGTCGEVPDVLVRLEPDVVAELLEESCTLTAADVWSEDGCTLERSFECIESGHLIEYVAVTTAEPGAAVIDGTMTATMRDAESEMLVCTGSYRVEMTRE